VTVFEQAFAIVVGEEGALSTDPADPGNWTGGACGRGICRGTKYGIAAAAHPELDIAALTLAQARSLYLAQYWDAAHASELPPPLALMMFDAAVNSGLEKAVRWLQAALGCNVDGSMGSATIGAARAHSNDSDGLCVDFLALRLEWLTTLPTWRLFGLGWTRRICGLPYAALKLAELE
jgi:lysozyme family protein